MKYLHQKLLEKKRYTHTDLYDFKANIEGAQKIYELFKPELEKKDKKLSSTIRIILIK